MKILIGGSPCTHWSIAQTKNRETEASGIGWELFLNYRIARDKYKPDFFLYENNKSMSPAIRAQITAELGVEPVLINSALVSAQNRQRLYWVGKRNPDGTYSQVPVELPENQGILLRDILETGFPLREKGYALQTGHSATAEDAITHRQRNAAAEPVEIKPLSEKEMEYMVRETKDGRNHFDFDYFHDATKEKGACVTANTHKGVPYNVLAEPVPVVEQDVRCVAQRGRYIGENGSVAQHLEVRDDGKTNTLTTVQKDNMVAVPVYAATTDAPICRVQDGKITANGKRYPIKLKDGYYIIRKLTVTECKRLQTVPDTYAFPVSDTQAYKMLGNGWTVDVIAHIMSHFTGLTEEPVEVLSMYDGMSCGHIALDKLGAAITAYYATEIDKYAVQTTQHNFPDTVQLGDAFQVRAEDWHLPEPAEMEAAEGVVRV